MKLLSNSSRTFLFALLFPITSFAADPWSNVDKARQAAYYTVTVIDWSQTRYIAKHPELYYETNVRLGKNPSTSDVNKFFLVSLIGHTAIVHYMPASFRPVFQYLTIGYEFSAVERNFGLGIKMDF